MQQYPVEFYSEGLTALTTTSNVMLPTGAVNYLVGSYTLPAFDGGVLFSGGNAYLSSGVLYASGGQLTVLKGNIVSGLDTDSGYVVVSTVNNEYNHRSRTVSSNYLPQSTVFSSDSINGDYYTSGGMLLSSGAVYSDYRTSAPAVITSSRGEIVYSGDVSCAVGNDDLGYTTVEVGVTTRHGTLVVRTVNGSLVLSSGAPDVIDTYELSMDSTGTVNMTPLWIKFYPAIYSSGLAIPPRSEVRLDGDVVPNVTGISIGSDAVYVTTTDPVTLDSAVISGPYPLSGGSLLVSQAEQVVSSGGYIYGSGLSGSSAYVIDFSAWSGALVGSSTTTVSGGHISTVSKEAINNNTSVVYTENTTIEDALVVYSGGSIMSDGIISAVSSESTITSTTASLTLLSGTTLALGTSTFISNGTIVSSAVYLPNVSLLLESCSRFAYPDYGRFVYSGGSVVESATDLDYPTTSGEITILNGASAGYFTGKGTLIRTSNMSALLPAAASVTLSGGSVSSGSCLTARLSGMFSAAGDLINIYAADSGALLYTSGSSGAPVSVLGSTLAWDGGGAETAGGLLRISGGTWSDTTPQQLPWIFSRAQTASGGYYSFIPTANNTGIRLYSGGSYSFPIYAGFFDSSVQSGDSAYIIDNAFVRVALSGGVVENTVPAMVTHYSLNPSVLYSGGMTVVASSGVIQLGAHTAPYNVVSGNSIFWDTDAQEVFSGADYAAAQGGAVDLSGTVFVSGGISNIGYSGGPLKLAAMGINYPVIVNTQTYERVGDYLFSGTSLSGAQVGDHQKLLCSEGGYTTATTVYSGGMLILSSGGVSEDVHLGPGAIPVIELLVYAGGTAASVYCACSNPFSCYYGGVISDITVGISGRLSANANIYEGLSGVREFGGVVNTESSITFFGHTIAKPSAPVIKLDSSVFSIDYTQPIPLSVASGGEQKRSWARQLYVSNATLYQDMIQSGYYLAYQTYNSHYIAVDAMLASGGVHVCSVTLDAAPSGSAVSIVSALPDMSLHSETTLVGAIIPPTQLYGAYNYGGTLAQVDFVNTSDVQVLRQSSANLSMCGIMVHTPYSLQISSGVYEELITKASATYIGSGAIVIPRSGTDMPSIGFISDVGNSLYVGAGGCVAGIAEYLPYYISCTEGGAISFAPISAHVVSGAAPVATMHFPGVWSSLGRFVGNIKLYDYQNWGISSILLGGNGAKYSHPSFTWVGGDFNSITILSPENDNGYGFSGSFIMSRYDRANMWGRYLQDYINRNIALPIADVPPALDRLSRALVYRENDLSSVSMVLGSAYTTYDSNYVAAYTAIGLLSSSIEFVSSGGDLLYSAVNIIDACTTVSGAAVPSPRDAFDTLTSGHPMTVCAVPGYYEESGGVLTGPGVVYSSGYCYNVSSGVGTILSDTLSSAYMIIVSGGLLVQSATELASAYTPFDPFVSSALGLIKTSSIPALGDDVSLELSLCSSVEGFSEPTYTLLDKLIPQIPPISATASGGHLIIQSGDRVRIDGYSTYIAEDVCPWTDYYMSRVTLAGGSLLIPPYKCERAYTDSDLSEYSPTLHIKELFISGGAVTFTCGFRATLGNPHAGVVDSFYVGTGTELVYGVEPELRDYTDRSPQVLCLASDTQVTWGAFTTGPLLGGVLDSATNNINITSTIISEGLVYSPLCVPSGASFTVFSLGLITSMGVLPGGNIYISNQGILEDCMVCGGTLTVSSGGCVSACTVYSGGTVILESGGSIGILNNVSS